MNIKHRILYIEDDTEMAFFLKHTIESELCVEVIIAYDYHEAERLMKDNDFSLFIIDKELPEISGIEIVNILRNKMIGEPIILYTSHTESQLVTESIRLGATDFVCKTDNITVFIAKIGLHLNGIINSNFILSDNSMFNTITGVLSCNGYEVELPGMLRKLLIFMVQNTNRIVTSREIESCLFRMEKNNASYDVRRYISKLKKALMVDDTLTIKNIHGEGYILIQTPKLV